MADVFSKSKRSDVMSRIRSKDTKPEIVLRKFLHGMGLRYRLHAKELPGRPDIVFRKRKIAVQVLGCFWHGHTCREGHTPKSNVCYWGPKIERNRERDRLNKEKLEAVGWTVIDVWECQIENKERFEEVKDRLKALFTGCS